MKKIITTSLIGLGLFVILILAAILWLQLAFRERVVVINNSNMEISRVELEFAGDQLDLEHIRPGQVVNQNITVKTDGSFDVKVYLEDGTVIEEYNLGYVTHGGGTESIFTLNQEKELDFAQKN